eukprot:253742_1
MALLFWLCTFIVCAFGNGFDLKELASDNAPPAAFTKNINKMDLIEWIITIPRKVLGVKRNFITRSFMGEYKIKPKSRSAFWLPRYTIGKENQKKRMRPQYVIAYNTQSNALIAWIEGTEQDSILFDWKNINNVVPKEIMLTNQNKKVDVHSGIYNAINTKLFYTGNDNNPNNFNGFINDLQSVINNVKQAKKPIKKLYIAGHSQGGAIATLITILWQSKVDCKFVNYIKQHASKKIQNLLDNAEVITYGAPGIFGHRNNGALQIDAAYHNKILNIINAKDAAPMMLSGNKKKPREPFKENDETLFDIAQLVMHRHAQAMLDEHDNKAYYGPVGRYVVIIEKKKWFGLKRDKVMLKRLNKKTIHDLYGKHLVNGADTVMQRIKTQIGKLLSMQFYHRTENGYRSTIHAAVKRYKQMMRKQEINVWILIYFLEFISLILISCGMIGAVLGKYVTKYYTKNFAKNMSNISNIHMDFV